MYQDRVRRLVQLAINSYRLDLSGLTVLTEAATGHYVWTPIICALAGAEKVIAYTSFNNDNEYGSIKFTRELTEMVARDYGVEDRVLVNKMPKDDAFAEADIVTNLGNARPISEYYIKLMKKDAVVTLMCEPWECRESDVDIRACRRHGIAVMGTDEGVKGLETFQYIGYLVVKLAMEMGIEIKCSKIAIIGRGYKGHTGKELLESMGAKVVTNLDPFVDALVVVEPNEYRELFTVEQIKDFNLAVIHIVGNINKAKMMAEGIRVNPRREVPPGRMSVALDYLGPKPMIDLHVAGLKVGEALVRGIRLKKGSIFEAEIYARKRAPAMSVNTVLKGRL